MIVVELSFDPTEASDWVVRSWQQATPTVITTTRVVDVEDALREALRLFQYDIEIDTVMKDRARAAVVAANSATIATAKEALMVAEGM